MVSISTKAPFLAVTLLNSSTLSFSTRMKQPPIPTFSMFERSPEHLLDNPRPLAEETRRCSTCPIGTHSIYTLAHSASTLSPRSLVFWNRSEGTRWPQTLPSTTSCTNSTSIARMDISSRMWIRHAMAVCLVYYGVLSGWV